MSLQQLIASFAAQSRQLGLHPAPRKTIVTASVGASASEGALSDAGQLTSCRYGMVKLHLQVPSDRTANPHFGTMTCDCCSIVLVCHASQQRLI